MLPGLGSLLDEADPAGLVAPRNRALCAGLGLLATSVHDALGGQAPRRDVLEAAALLSLLTKVDDQIIDALAFHGGPAADRREALARTRAYLAPTLRSQIEARPAADEGRCRLAAEAGRRYLAASRRSPLRRREVLALVARGWRVQERAVAVLGAHPAATTLAEVERVTADISGVWLMMMAAVGTLAAPRGLSAAERRAILGWGAWIQRADALADLAKDTADGLWSSLPGRLLFDLEPAGYLDACERRDTGAFFQLLRHHRVDEACLPPPRQLDLLGDALGSLGELPSLLRWIHGFLVWRYTLLQPAAPFAPAYASFSTDTPIFPATTPG